MHIWTNHFTLQDLIILYIDPIVNVRRNNINQILNIQNKII